MSNTAHCGSHEHHKSHYWKRREGETLRFCMGETTLEGRIRDLEETVEDLKSWVHYSDDGGW